MRPPHLSLAGLRRLGSVLAVIGAAWLLSAVPAAADSSANDPDGSGKGEAVKPASLSVEKPASGSDDSGDGAAVPVNGVADGSSDGSSADDEKIAAQSSPKPAKKRPAKERRGGIHPCMTPDPGFGIYDGWSSAPSVGHMIAPHKGGITKSGGFDLVVHFHGHEPIRKEFVKTAKGPVLVGIDLGIGSGAYSKGFAAPNVFPGLLRSVEAAMAQKTGKKTARVRKLALSSWSAGYGAIEQILRQTGGKNIDSVVLLDSLHAGYADEQQKTLKVELLEPFIDFAKKAAAKQRFMFMSHSSIIPPGYASTQETANFVIKQLKGKPKKASRQDVLGLDLFQRYDKGNFKVRGYTGNDKPDHCAHIGLMADIMRVHLAGRWKSPRGKR
ncbi:MAG TPA: hypothetical protein VK459_15660 [Polyangiaceae bacterium]|jgi:hypothetical protein|nr:hypothetical protein [Polyangiaceae bacterium]